MKTSTQTRSTTRWGRTRSGKYSVPVVAIPLGFLVSGLFGLIPLAFISDLNPFLVWLIFTIALAPVACALVWVIVVKRETITGAVRNPEQTVETQWATRAHSIGFFAMVILTGWGSFFSSFFFNPEVAWVSLFIAIFGVVVYLIVYFAQKVQS